MLIQNYIYIRIQYTHMHICMHNMLIQNIFIQNMFIRNMLIQNVYVHILTNIEKKS